MHTIKDYIDILNKCKTQEEITTAAQIIRADTINHCTQAIHNIIEELDPDHPYIPGLLRACTAIGELRLPID